MREVIALMQLMDEVNKVFKLQVLKPQVHCNVYDDNGSYIAMATARKFSTRTKHIPIKYHHFRRFVEEGSISLHSIDTKEQTADIFTKALEQKSYEYKRRKLCGW